MTGRGRARSRGEVDHFAIPLLIKMPGGLVVEVTDETAEYNAKNYRVTFYDLAKAANIRMAFALAHELKAYGFTDLDGPQPDAGRYVPDVHDAGKPADPTGHR